MSLSVAEKMRDACLTPVFTVDEQIMRVTNCESNGFTLTPGGVEPELAEIPVTPRLPRDTVDSENTIPGSGGAGDFADGKEPVQEQPKSENAAIAWVKKNPVPTIGIAAALLFVLTSRK